MTFALQPILRPALQPALNRVGRRTGGGGAPAPTLPTTGLVGRYEAADIQSSAGTFTSWNDSSGAANHIISAPSAPTVETITGRQGVKFVSGNYLAGPAIAFNARSMSAFFVVRRTAVSAFLIGTHDGNLANLSWASQALTINDGANKFSTRYSAANRSMSGFRCSATDSRVHMGAEDETLTVCGVATGTGFLIGKHFALSATMAGTIEAIYIYNTAISDLELAQLRDYVAYTYQAAAKSTARFIVAKGDSITAGFGLANSWETWPSQWSRLYTEEPKYMVQATTGQTVATMNTLIATQITPFYAQNAAYAERWVTLIGGTNDIDGSSSAATVQTEITNFHNNVRGTGYKSVSATIPAVKSWAPGSAKDNVRLAVNTWLRANYLTISDVLCDLAADARLSDGNNLTYYQADGTHPNATGMAVIAELMRAALP